MQLLARRYERILYQTLSKQPSNKHNPLESGWPIANIYHAI